MKSRILLAIGSFVLSAGAARAAGGSGKVVFFGADFSRAAFYDEHLVKERAMTEHGWDEPTTDLVQNKIPSWNRECAIFFGQASASVGWPHEMDVDLGESDQINKGIAVTAVKWGPPPRSDIPALTPEVLSSEVKPYLSPDSQDLGALLFVDQISKPVGAIVQFIVFDRADGKILLAKRYETKASGFGLRNYYLNALKDALKKGMKEARSALARSGS